ncbi:MAG TPA: diadenylate cyclase CdaA [Candidatus Limnocylindrales bacterium]|nr:diadenylate cyclase CdaA [Candidatus Limnocylindrales bacterium]
MPQLLQSILEQVRLASVLDIAITAVLIYWLFSLIRGTSAVRLVIGVSVLFAVYFAARVLNLRLLTQILETGAVVGLFALVVIFQPELRRALDRIGRVGSFGWLVSPESRHAEMVAGEVARAAGLLSAEGHGALMVIERETGLEQIAETGVMIHGDLSADLLRTIFSPRSPLHDGAVVIRGSRILAAGTVLPLGETTMQSERFGTRHRAALGTTEQTDAIVVVVSEENGQISLVERARIRRNLNEAQLARALRTTLEPPTDRARLRAAVPANGAARIAELRQAVRRERVQALEPLPPDEPMGEHEPEAPKQAGPADGRDGVPGDGTQPPVTRKGDPEPAGTRGRAG